MLRRRRSPSAGAAEDADEEKKQEEEVHQVQPISGGLDLIGQEMVPLVEEKPEGSEDDQKGILANTDQELYGKARTCQLSSSFRRSYSRVRDGRSTGGTL